MSRCDSMFYLNVDSTLTNGIRLEIREGSWQFLQRYDVDTAFLRQRSVSAKRWRWNGDVVFVQFVIGGCAREMVKKKLTCFLPVRQ